MPHMYPVFQCTGAQAGSTARGVHGATWQRHWRSGCCCRVVPHPLQQRQAQQQQQQQQKQQAIKAYMMPRAYFAQQGGLARLATLAAATGLAGLGFRHWQLPLAFQV
uniref:Uncharacterized protein n=1 Tax=Tetradesmus obliquus TaxID=3088 RepID=A0A383VBE0_TETOB